MFSPSDESELGSEYLREGYIIRDVADVAAQEWIVTATARLAAEQLNAQVPSSPASSVDFLNKVHTLVSSKDLNEFRLKVIQGLNSLPTLRSAYFSLARPFLEEIVGNELAMQQRVNLSVQLPGDSSSLLAVHADTWSGDSPYEVVVWLPLVDCYATKSMYLLPPKHAEDFNRSFKDRAGRSSETLFEAIRDRVQWLEIRCGQVMVFDQSLPHGNRINEESDTRWSMNCRFKGVFTPYGDKKLGEFFEPISLRPASRRGMTYELPHAR
jgi:sporadic carbohydrate cluster 2OG-Fe(II) oxygenase